MDVRALATELRAEALATDERRLIVLAGDDRSAAYAALDEALAALDVGISETTLVGPEDRLRCPHLTQSRADQLLGTTRTVIVVDGHEAFRPNALGSVVGAVDGGGLVVLLTPPLESWPDRRDSFDETLTAPPFDVEDVSGHVRTRLVETLTTHPGIAVVDVDRDRIERDGSTDPPPRLDGLSSDESRIDRTPKRTEFPIEAFDACRTADQVDAVAAFEGFTTTDRGRQAVVLEADRGRGKSSAAGLAAGSLAIAGRDVVVTAPSKDNAVEVFARAAEILTDQDATESVDGSAIGPQQSRSNGDAEVSPESDLRSRTGGAVRFEPVTDVDDWIDEPDVVIVDEAAALPVSILDATLRTDRVAYATTVHGYEGAGRGFSVRFRERLERSDHDLTDLTLTEPIRYAAGDPIETWAFRVLALDARPPVEPLVSEASTESVNYCRPSSADLAADEHRLREAFGLLVLAHYRTEPTDLARLLDAPNIVVRTLEHDGHVVAVALLAREGGLDRNTREKMYDGDRIRGNMIPDVLTSQLRDEAAGRTIGYRIVRIATHHAVRSRGLGSRLLEEIAAEFASAVDWLGSGFGATPELLRFWTKNGYRTTHTSTTRNDRSGEYSAIVLSPTSDAGRSLVDRHARWFARRVPAVFSDALDDLDADTARAILASVPDDAAPALTDRPHDWRVIAGAAYGPGLFDVDPGPFRPLLVRYLIERPDSIERSEREERLFVRRGLQAGSWPAVADELDYHSPGQCMRSFGAALTPLVTHYGTNPDLVGDESAETVRSLRTRFLGNE
ncbi:tRNA(Met) cytidine acetyltransferase TmcA [Halovivax gelatinilyticus]|uniref:tRNA(Met) cytidine acetyltransferase TmcA n=1 Tax=Halovivax gelatinilyticus TaxID=2961597 RepID=UPI0020CA8074|nr:tRNA(Met) cytidine acetyltransferase TmcA [Halovivax gelatinilyticus]